MKKQKKIILIALAIFAGLLVTAVAIMSSYLWPKIQRYSSRTGPGHRTAGTRPLPTPAELSARVAEQARNTPPEPERPLLERTKTDYSIEFFRDEEIMRMISDDEFVVEYRKVPAFPIPPKLLRILGLDEHASNYEERITDIETLAPRLSTQEINALFAFLHKRSHDDPLPLLEFNAVKNDVAAALLNQENFPHEYPLHFVAIFHDRSFDSVWRDYSVQFLGQCYLKISDPEQAAMVREVFQLALDDAEGIPAAALIALAELADKPGFEKRQIAEKACKMAATPGSPEPVRTTALQIAAKLAANDTAKTARTILKSTSSSVMLKISAIAALGRSGGHDDIKPLEPLLKSSDTRIRSAAKSAIRMLKKTSM